MANYTKNDLTGLKFGCLVALEETDKRAKGGCIIWKFKCEDCGKISELKGSDVKVGRRTCSCKSKPGPKRGELPKAQRISTIAFWRALEILEVTNPEDVKKIKKDWVSLRKIFQRIKTRCYNSKNSSYHLYGGAGIEVCEEWKDNFIAFYKWSIKNGYTGEETINRKDPKKSYTPDNSFWDVKFKKKR